MLDAHAHVMQVKLCKANTRGVTVLGSMQDRCTICAKRTIGSGIILDTSDGTPR